MVGCECNRDGDIAQISISFLLKLSFVWGFKAHSISE